FLTTCSHHSARPTLFPYTTLFRSRDSEIEKIRILVRHDDQLKIARLVEAAIETPRKGRISPGDVVKVRTVLKPYRGEAFVETFEDRKSTRLNSSHVAISYAVFCLK